MITQEYLKSILDYNHKTGEFHWISQKRGNIPSNMLAGNIDNLGYVRITIKGKRYMAHRLAWLYIIGKFPEFCIDHENGIKSDNRWQNLRNATFSQNSHNSKLFISNTSGYKGVYWCKNTNRWIASIIINGDKHHIGVYKNKDEAGAARIDYAKNNLGKFFNEKGVKRKFQQCDASGYCE